MRCLLGHDWVVFKPVWVCFGLVRSDVAWLALFVSALLWWVLFRFGFWPGFGSGLGLAWGWVGAGFGLLWDWWGWFGTGLIWLGVREGGREVEKGGLLGSASGCFGLLKSAWFLARSGCLWLGLAWPGLVKFVSGLAV